MAADDIALPDRQPGLDMPGWMQALGAGDPEVLRRRLAWGGFSPDRAEEALECATEADAQAFGLLQDWLGSGPQIKVDGAAPGPGAVAFDDLWLFAAQAALKDLARRLPPVVAAAYAVDEADWGDYAQVRANLADDLVARLCEVAEGVLWQAFDQARTRSQIIMAHLDRGPGGPPRHAYGRFLEALRADRLEALTARYPVLRRHLATALNQWLAASAELLSRIHGDLAALADAFDLPAGARLASVHTRLSDPHRGGRTVARLTFRGPADPARAAFVAYKPKDLRMDAALQAVLAQAPAPGPADPPLATLKVLPRAGYGYMAWVPHRLCADEEALASFYRQAGRLAAVLFLLGCSDAHHENLIACGDQLLLIDAETLFEGVPIEHRIEGQAPLVRSDLQRRIDASIVRTGLLPRYEFVGAERQPLDVSALGVAPPAGAIGRAMGWVAINTDGMIAGEVEAAADLPTSLPVGFGQPNRFGDFAEAFCAGFQDQLAAIAADRARWLADDGPLAPFAGLKRRFISRPTWMYQWLRRQQLEPRALGSEAAQALVLERLARSYLVSEQKPRSWPMFAAEAAQMQALDIPFFEQGVAGHALDLPDGARIDGFMQVSGHAQCRARIAGLDGEGVDFQVRLIRGVVSARAGRPATTPGGSPVVRQGTTEPQAEPRLAEAVALGDRIVASAILQGDGSMEWLGVDESDDMESAGYGPLGPSLYGGRAGVALFLAALARQDTARSRTYASVALAAVSDLRRLVTQRGRAAQARWWRDQPMGLAGGGGILLALLVLRTLLLDLAAELDDGLPELTRSLDTALVEADQQIDMIRGSAGLIGALLWLGSPQAMDLAQTAADTLVRRQGSDGGWTIPAIGPRALTGFSHGAAGMAAALARLHAVTGHGRYAEAAARALAYERGVFSPQHRNWPDYRPGEDGSGPHFQLAWCHGAPGIALSRLCLAGTALWDPAAEQELRTALAVSATPEAASDSVCCGRYGRAAILRLAGRGRNPRWLAAAEALDQPFADTPPGARRYSFLDKIALFTGAAGVGLALLDGLTPAIEPVLPCILSAGLSVGPAFKPRPAGRRQLNYGQE